MGQPRLGCNIDPRITVLAGQECPNWAFVQSYAIVLPIFLQFGNDYMEAPDDYVYIYANELKNALRLEMQVPGENALMRAPKMDLMDRSQYEFYA